MIIQQQQLGCFSLWEQNGMTFKNCAAFTDAKLEILQKQLLSCFRLRGMTGNVVPNVCCLEAPSPIRPDFFCGKAFCAALPSRSQSNRNYRMLVLLSYFHADHTIEQFPPERQNRMLLGFFLIGDVLMLLDVLLGNFR